MYYHTQVAWPYTSSAVQPPLWGQSSGNSVPRMDLLETENELVYIFEMPGSNSEQIDVEITGEGLQVGGPIIPLHGKTEPHMNLRHQERPAGRYFRLVALPASQVSSEQIAANYNNGLLEVKIKKGTAPGNKIRVSS